MSNNNQTIKCRLANGPHEDMLLTISTDDALPYNEVSGYDVISVVSDKGLLANYAISNRKLADGTFLGFYVLPQREN